MNLKQILQTPHPFIFNRNSVIIPFVVTVLVVLLYRPFEFAAFSFFELISWSLLFGFIVALTVLLVVKSLQKGFPNFMLEENWTIGKEMGLVFGVIICIMAAFLSCFIYKIQKLIHYFCLGKFLLEQASSAFFPF